MEDDDEEDDDDGGSENSSEQSGTNDIGAISSSPKASKAGKRKKLYRKSRKKSQTNSPLRTPTEEERVPPITTGTESEEEDRQNERTPSQRRASRPTRKKAMKNKNKTLSSVQNSMVSSTSELFPDMGLETNTKKSAYYEKDASKDPASSSSTGLVSYLRVNEGYDVTLYRNPNHTNLNEKLRRVASAIVRSFNHTVNAHDDMRPISALDVLSNHTDTKNTQQSIRTQTSPPSKFAFHYPSYSYAPAMTQQMAGCNEIIPKIHTDTKYSSNTITNSIPSSFEVRETTQSYSSPLIQTLSNSKKNLPKLDKFVREVPTPLPKINLEFEEDFTKRVENREPSKPQLVAMANGSVSIGACLRRSSLHGTPQRYIISQSRRCSLLPSPTRGSRSSLLSSPTRARTSFNSYEKDVRPFTAISPLQNMGNYTGDANKSSFASKSSFAQSAKVNRTDTAEKTTQRDKHLPSFSHNVASLSSATFNKFQKFTGVKLKAFPSATRKQNTNISQLISLKARNQQEDASKTGAILQEKANANRKSRNPSPPSKLLNKNADTSNSKRNPSPPSKLLNKNTENGKSSRNASPPSKMFNKNTDNNKKNRNPSPPSKTLNTNIKAQSSLKANADKNLGSPKKVPRSKSRDQIPSEINNKQKDNNESNKVMLDSSEEIKNVEKSIEEGIGLNTKRKTKLQNVKDGDNLKRTTNVKNGNIKTSTSAQKGKNNTRNIDKVGDISKLGPKNANGKAKRALSPPKFSKTKSDIDKFNDPASEHVLEAMEAENIVSKIDDTKNHDIDIIIEDESIVEEPNDISNVDKRKESINSTNDTLITSESLIEEEPLFNGYSKSPPNGSPSKSPPIPAPSRKGRRKSSLSDIMGDSEMLSKLHKLKTSEERKSKSVSQMETGSLEQEEGEDAFAEEMPEFAKSYILSKPRQKKSIQRLHTVSEYGTQDAEDVYNNPNVPEAFKFEMLKAALDYDGGLSTGDKIEKLQPIKNNRRGTRTSFGNAVAEFDPSGFDNSFESGRTTRAGMNSRMSSHSNKHSSWSEGKRPKVKKKKSAPGADLVPCTGPGSLRDYGEYLKAGGFVPVPVMDAEEGVKKGTFALNKPTKDEGYDLESEWGIPGAAQGNAAATLDFAELSIQRQFDSIQEKYRLPEDDQIITEEERQAANALKSMGFVPNTGEQKTDMLSGKGDSLLDDKTAGKKKPRRESLAKKAAAQAKKKPKKKKAFDDDLFGDDDDEDDQNNTKNEPANGFAADSGYSSARKSSFGGSNPPVSSGSTLPPIFGDGSSRGSDDEDLDSIMELDNDPTLKAYQEELKEQRLLDEALKGQNLLGMMLEDKPKYGQQAESGTTVEGVDAIDLFLDPMSVFGSERHPALQEVLKQIEKQKEQRGDELAKLKKIAKELKQQRGMVGRLRGMV